MNQKDSQHNLLVDISLQENLVSNQQEQSEQQNKNSIFNKLDIFSFLPIPITNKISTNRSVIGSIMLVSIFLIYIITTLYMFITNNPPKMNAISIPIDNSKLYDVPSFSFTFVYGENLDTSFYDESYFTYVYQQTIIHKDNSRQREQIDSPLVQCDRSEIKNWMGQTNYTKLFCPQKQLIMQGNLYTADVQKSARIKIEICHDRPGYCKNISEINRIIKGGRLFFFIRKNNVVDHTTGDVYAQTFSVLNFYLVNGIYQKNMIIIQQEQQIIKPDYLNRFSDKIRSTYHVSKQKTFIQITPNQQQLALIQIMLDEEQVEKDYFYRTSIELISQWGALWGVLFALLAIYFISYNQKVFYKRNPHWENYVEKEKIIEEQLKLIDTKFEQLQTLNRTIERTIETRAQQIQIDSNNNI